MFGFLNINKPSGITSNRVITILRKITGIKQIGHAGTLDPLASGVLPVAIGKASKLIDYLPENKEYTAGIFLGKTSDTYDTEGNVKETGFRKIEQEEIEKVLPFFKGNVFQIPPAYSAVHYNGKRLYELARNGIIPEDIPKREITIYKNEIISFDYENQILKLNIACSKGTYIRTIVHDIGQMLGCGGVMFELIRTKSSGFCINNAINLSDDLTKDTLSKQLINPASVISIPIYELNDEENQKIINGNKFNNRKDITGTILLTKSEQVLAVAHAEIDYIQPKKVLL